MVYGVDFHKIVNSYTYLSKKSIFDTRIFIHVSCVYDTKDSLN